MYQILTEFRIEVYVFCSGFEVHTFYSGKKLKYLNETLGHIQCFKGKQVKPANLAHIRKSSAPLSLPGSWASLSQQRRGDQNRSYIYCVW